MTNPAINLFRGRKQSFFDKFMKWALTFGRFVVIFTETIALAAFIYRFSLDRQLIDLHGNIKQKQAIVKLFKDNEDIYRNLQDRLTLAAKLSETGKETVTIFNDVIRLAPSGLTFDNLLLSENQIKIDARMQSVAALANFVKTLKEYPKITSVSINKIENRSSSATIIVSITATLKKQAQSIMQ